MLGKKLWFFVLLLIVSVSMYAQLPVLPSDLTTLRSADISNEQVNEIAQYLNDNQINLSQAYYLLLSKGMQPPEASQLRTRIEQAGSTTAPITASPGNVTTSPERYTYDTTVKTIRVNNPKRIFGLEIFNNGVLSFEPNLNIATPVGYIIGPNDEINVNIYGYQEARYNLRVSPEGDINIPYVGVLYVAGMTIEQATEKIRSKLAASGYTNIRTGLTKVSVSIGRIRSIKVTVLGEVRNPGSYTVPSLATAFNALYLSGGPTEIGSMRNIEIIRNGRIIDKLDIYDFLVKGDLTGNLLLRDQDIIRIPAYDVRVSLEGQVKRAGLYEIKPGENLLNLLEFAGGFSDSAYTASITAYKITDTERKITDVPNNKFDTYLPARSESYVVKKIAGRFVNRVTITGAVYLPGDYELTPGMTIRDLIQKAQGLQQDAYGLRGIITRRQADLTPEFVSFSPAGVMQNAPANILLRANDVVSIASVSNLRENTSVTIEGEVRNTGTFPFVENMTLKDLILVAGGFTDAAIPQRIELARRLKSDTFSVDQREVSQVFDIRSVKDLDLTGGEILLEPYDAVVVRKNPAYQPQSTIRVEGEVLYPGPYVLTTKNERISDVIKRAGGLTYQAFLQGSYVIRENDRSVLNDLNREKVTRMQETLRDSSTTVQEDIERTEDRIAIDLGDILASPGSRNDLILEEGDVIHIPKVKMDVRISGQVLFPTRVVYDQQLSLKDYLGRAGGVTDNARLNKVYVLYPNGNAARTSHFLFFRSFPEVRPGAEIIVPKKHEVERRRLSTGEIIGITTALTSFAGVLLSVLINSK